MPPGFSSADFFYLLPELVLTGGALLLLVADVLLPRRAGLLMWLALGTLGAAAVMLWPLAGVQLEVARGLVAIDSFALFFKVLFLLAAALTVLLSARYLAIEGMNAGEFYFLILCSTLGMMFMASGIDLISLFIGLETMAISFYILVGYLKPSRRSMKRRSSISCSGPSRSASCCTGCHSCTACQGRRIFATWRDFSPSARPTRA